MLCMERSDELTRRGKEIYQDDDDDDENRRFRWISMTSLVRHGV